MNFKKMILVLTITFSAIFTLMLGSSYAYYVSTGGTTLNATTGNFDSAVAVVFNQSQYINVKTGIPIKLSDVETKAGRIFFTLIPDNNVLSDDYEASVTISLTDISIDEELRMNAFKYSLQCDEVWDDGDIMGNAYSKSGTGEDFTDEVLNSDNLVIRTIKIINPSNYYECDFYVYLKENDSDQNHLMNKNFSARIKVNTAFRK
ncbi:MAG: hypothetical protein IJZ46_01000 [Bacilli bacterium]|nr:hypothetical protein [Bacilli bacterium]